MPDNSWQTIKTKNCKFQDSPPKKLNQPESNTRIAIKNRYQALEASDTNDSASRLESSRIKNVAHKNSSPASTLNSENRNSP